MGTREYEIDEFEKLYALTSAKVNASSVISDDTFRDEDFDKICTLAKYKLEHREQFEGANQEINESEENFYMIPRKVTQKVRYGNSESNVIKEINILNDPAGNGLYIVMDDGVVRKTKELRDEIEFGKIRYAKEIETGRISAKEIEDLFEFDNINQIAEEIRTGELSLDKVQEKIDVLVKSRGLRVRPITGYVNEAPVKQRDDDEPQEELEPPEDEEIGDEELDEEEKSDDEEIVEKEGRAVTDEEEEPDIEEQAAAIGISASMIEMLAEKYKCKPSQINFRKIEDYEKLQEDTGLNLRQYRGKVWAMKLDYGVQEKYYLINSETGERFENYRFNDGTVAEVQDYFKYPTRVGEDTRSLRDDEGRSYITYLDENGNMKEMKYINNGRRDDMLRDERQRYIAEVAKVNEILQNAIDVYQKDNTQENWLRVKDAMQARIAIDRKYRIKERDFDNQRNTTVETLKETIDETQKGNRTIEDDEDDWGPWSRHMHH